MSDELNKSYREDLESRVMLTRLGQTERFTLREFVEVGGIFLFFQDMNLFARELVQHSYVYIITTHKNMVLSLTNTNIDLSHYPIDNDYYFFPKWSYPHVEKYLGWHGVATGPKNLSKEEITYIRSNTTNIPLNSKPLI